MRFATLAFCLTVVSCERVSLTPFALEPCHLDGLAEEVRCGVHEVFEDRDVASGRDCRFRLRCCRPCGGWSIPIRCSSSTADPGRARADSGAWPPVLQEGAALSRHRARRPARHRRLAPLQCPDAGDGLSSTVEEIAAQVRQCRDALTANPRLYTHAESLADVDEIRERLGYETINLWGGSWGTRAALLYALRYPEATRSLVLDGAAPLDLEFPRTASADANAALNRLLTDCAVDRDCARAFPNPRAMLRELEGRFAAGPVSTRLKHPRTGEPTTVLLQAEMVMEIIRGALYMPRDAAAVLVAIRQAVDGDFSPLAAQGLRTASWSLDDMALGATYAVLCSEDLPRTAGVDFAADAKGSFFGTVYADVWRVRCADWPAGVRWTPAASQLRRRRH